MNESSLRQQYQDAMKGRDSIKGFWHSRAGKEIRKALQVVPFNGFETVQEKVWALTNDSTTPPACKCCGKRASFYQYGYLETCGVSCASKLTQASLSDSVKDAAQRKRVEGSLTAKARKKRSETMLDTLSKRGDDIRELTKETNLVKYGVIHPAHTKEFHQKIQSTNQQRYGGPSYLSSPEARGKARETRLKTYESDVLPKRVNEFRELGYQLKETTWHGVDHKYPWVHVECGTEFLQSLEDGRLPECPQCKPRSKPEQSIVDFIMSLGLGVEHNNRAFIKPYEIDILIPSKKLAIEINGVYWHREDSTSLPLVKKTQMVEQNGYQLLHFWDYEVERKPEIVKSIIRSKLGLLENKIGASRCKLVNVSYAEAKEFANDNHLGGYADGGIRIGLEYKGELIALGVFSKPRFPKRVA